VVLCCFILKERDSFFSQISKNEMSAVVIYGWRTVGFADKEISEEEEGRRLDSSVDSYQRRRRRDVDWIPLLIISEEEGRADVLLC